MATKWALDQMKFVDYKDDWPREKKIELLNLIRDEWKLRHVLSLLIMEWGFEDHSVTAHALIDKHFGQEVDEGHIPTLQKLLGPHGKTLFKVMEARRDEKL
jgi:hypothetical protein